MTGIDDLETVTFNKGDVIFEQGALANRAYIIHKGIVMVTSSRGGQEIVVDSLRRGDFVGEMALVDDKPRSATAIAGEETVCAVLTQEFLEFIQARGNDLITPHPEFGFPGLRAGDQWCVCAASWYQAYEAGVACPVKLESTHGLALEIVPLKALIEHSVAAEA